MSNSNSRLVYSDENNSICRRCNKPLQKCQCRNAVASSSTGDGVVRVQRSTKGRKGKGVTLITGVPLGGEELKTLAKTLKQKCGSGGTVKAGVIEIQGDHRDFLLELLREKGWTVKKAGG
ncbi:MAG: translation initiation factor Sui1 [Desulfuromonadales bacterium]|nr:translation initiation factor Sui1 [Desulfuromonadales bacterium]